MKTLLAIDDELSVREAYRLILSDRYRVLLAPDGATALRLMRENHVDLILLDMVMPTMGGMDVLDEIVKIDNLIPVIVVTAIKSVATAVTAIKHGAKEYIIKPFDVEEILLMVEKALAESQKEQELTMRRRADASGFEAIIGQSAALNQTIALARRAAQVDSTVLITGESGTGKDLIARAIHAGGGRAKNPFVAVSCCAIPNQLVESELFGHEKGAFTGASEKRVGKMQVADRGTLFLDEIGEMPLEAQAKLLRVLQGGQFYPVGSTKVIEVDIRFICATNRDLREAVKQGIFREDLFYRVNVLHVEMPPLRARRDDIPVLIEHFVAKHRLRVNARARRIAPDAMAVMVAYEWPGNIRELENMVERILVMNSTEEEIRREHLTGVLKTAAKADAPAATEFEGLGLEEATSRLERRLIMRALEQCDNVQSRAADMLGTTRRILKYKMDQLGIEAAPEREATGV
ncbi:MAG: sigma-54-dependent Fis family transcriptional regulator [Candidatus Hydrogenedentes bacterium]|nr:sigma-54-dependent Fis family transcriptional regulator [Candidatus Hydrogenedentota bacterium]